MSPLANRNTLSLNDRSFANQGRSIIVVIGMHRSGTSLCSNMLGLMGVDMAEDAGSDGGNEFGHFERWDLVKCNDEVLALFDRDYWEPTHDFPMPPAWWTDFRIRPIKDRVKALLTPVMARGGFFGFKDPRTVRLLPMWNQIFIELGLFPKFVVCLRDPAHVAHSLQVRDGLDRDAGELRALDYMVDAFRYTRGRDRCFINYDDWMPDPLPNAYKLLEFIGREEEIDRQDFEVAVFSVVRPELNRSGPAGGKSRQPVVRSFFELADRFARSGGADALLDEKIDRFTHSYIAFRQLLRPFELRFKAESQARTMLAEQLASAELHREAARVQAEQAVTELRTGLADLTASLAETEAGRNRTAQSELTAVQKLTEAQHALEAERASSVVLQQEIARAQARADEAEHALAGSRCELTAALNNIELERCRAGEIQADAQRELAALQEVLEQERASAMELRKERGTA